ncbi:type 4b pilus protein PilO2 [Limnobacter sp.]|uniref:type 4b pilus protein PilO2 n=1 Tax=Limnobacter sp. TaxID=2003368 RepID=UPI0035172DE9
MKEQTSVIGNFSKKLMVAGLSWQPVFAKRFFGRMAEVREYSQLMDSNLWSSVKAAKVLVAGFDPYDESVSKEERTEAPYALAAVLARAYKDADTLVAWRIRTGDRLGEVALVVIENGVPTMDVIATESETIAMMEYYQRSREGMQPYRVVSNDTKIWMADQHIEDDSAFIKKHVNRADKINSVPLDYKNLGQIALVVALLVGALVGYEYYQAETQRRILAEQIAQADKTIEYGQALTDNLGRVGLATAEYSKLLNMIYDQPFYVTGWAMEAIECKFAACVMRWKSVGGYTQQLQAALPADKGYVVQLNRADPFKAVVLRNFDVPMSGPTIWSDLPSKADLDVWALNQRQVYELSKLKIEMFSEPEIWPLGYPDIARDNAVVRYRFRFQGGVANAEAFIAAQEKSTYWEGLTLRFNNETSGTPTIELDLQGAYYAY